MKKLLVVFMTVAVATVLADTPKVEDVKEKKLTGRPAKIASDAIVNNPKEGTAIFEGHAHVDDEQYQMHADRVCLFFDVDKDFNSTNAVCHAKSTDDAHRAAGDARLVVAIGHVAMTNGARRAYGAKATYSKKDGLVVLYSGDGITAEVHDESKAQPQIVRGKRIRFWIGSEQVEVDEADLTSESVTTVLADTPKFEDFKVKLAGVAVMSAGANDDEELKPLPPQTRIVVTPGKLAAFYLEYSFPTNIESKIQLAPNYAEDAREELPCCFSIPQFVSGTGTVVRSVFVRGTRRKPYKEAVLLKSVRISGELEAMSGAPRNNEFVICDEPVNVLFANDPDSDGKDAIVLTPKPTPQSDPKLGVVPFDENAKPLSSTPAGFTDNLDAALAKAKQEGKFVYVCFCGSDWCGPCKRLESEVFAQPEFVPAVEKDYVLVFIDAPTNRGLLSARAKKENPKLFEKYGILGVPRALILDGDGNKLGETGYRKGGAKPYAEHLLEIKRKR